MSLQFSKALCAIFALVAAFPTGLQAYQPCPLLRAYFPTPDLSKANDSLNELAASTKVLFDDLMETGYSEDFGSVTPNTTSFTVLMFSGAGGEATDDTIFFEYSYTAPEANAQSPVDIDTPMPLGTLTQLFTVYTWLAAVGDGEWETPITEFLPELASVRCARDAKILADWDDITIGALAGYMSGLARDSNACKVVESCDRDEFIHAMAVKPPYFLPDTTPVISNAAFQLLAFALEARSNGPDFEKIISDSVFQPLKMTHSSLYTSSATTGLFGNGINDTAVGEPAALSMVSSGRDLARAGQAMLSSELLSPVVTRRWLQPTADTSNLRNGVGRPWEVYHAGQHANSSILDIFMKSGEIGHYSSYFGLSPDFNVGFAILAHDTETEAPDLNVHADVVSLGIEGLISIAGVQLGMNYIGEYSSDGPEGNFTAKFGMTNAPGLVVEAMQLDDTNILEIVADAAGIALENLDLRAYPSNAASSNTRQFVLVAQDISAPVDMGTPTCVTWKLVGILGPQVPSTVVFEVDEDGQATDAYIVF